MKGSAPNSPATGSQVSVRQKLRPNLLIDSTASRLSSKAMPATISTMRKAKKPVPSLKPRSGYRKRRVGLDTGSLTLRNLDLRQGRHLELDDGLGQWRVAEVSAVLLAVGQCPLHEVHHGLGLALVLRVLVEQQPREGRNRVHPCARR